MNYQKEYIKIAKVFVKKFSKNKNVIGITLSGGVSRNTGDIFSEIDLNFYVRNKKDKTLPPEHDINVNNLWFDFKILDIKEEKEETWSMDKVWDSANCKILFDRNKQTYKLIKQKINLVNKQRRRLLKDLKFKSHWCIILAETFMMRKNLKHAHLMVNESLNAFIDAYFLINNKFIPHYKWKYYYFLKLKKPSSRVKKIIFNLFLIKNYSKQELITRIKTVKKEIIEGDLKVKYFKPHKQNKKAVKDFIFNLKKGIKYESPW